MRFMSVRSLLFLSFLSLAALPAWAASPVATLSCTPGEGEVSQESKVKTFDLVSGKETNFSCTVTNRTKENIDIRLNGRQIHIGSKTAPVLSVADVVLKPEEQGEITVVFPAVFSPGTYHYAFALVDLNQQSLTPEELFSGRLTGEEKPTIDRVTPDATSYRWGSQVGLTVQLGSADNQPITPGVYSLRAELLGVSGAVCQVLVDQQAVEAIETKLSTTLPSDAGNCANDIVVTLRDQSGVAVASSTVAISLPARDDAPLGGQSSMFTRSMVWVGVAALAIFLLGLWFVLRRRQKTVG